MPNYQISHQPRFLSTRQRTKGRPILASLLGLAVWCAGTFSSKIAWANPPETAPAELKSLLENLDRAANTHNVEAVMAFYDQNFTHSDGLNYQTMAAALTELWQRYPQLAYRTELLSWEQEGDAIIAETATHITGVQQRSDRDLALDATITARQRYENQQIIQQEILAERTQLTSGANPPSVQVNLPAEVPSGGEYHFDAIVEEPLGNDLLLGAVVDAPVNGTQFFNAAPLQLEFLSAGGIFKVGQAPMIGQDRWISAVIVRGDGMTVITRRLHVIGPNPSAAAPSTISTQ